MIKYKTTVKNQPVDVTEVDDILCNLCGKSLSDAYHRNYEGLESVVVHGGFGSNYIGDMVSVTFSICEECLVKDLFPRFKIPVQVKSRDCYGPNEWVNGYDELYAHWAKVQENLDSRNDDKE